MSNTHREVHEQPNNFAMLYYFYQHAIPVNPEPYQPIHEPELVHHPKMSK